MSSNELLCVVPARGGSKGILKKNLIDFNGKPLIAWTIEAALASRGVDRVIVSTDSEEIAAVALSFGAEVPFMRPKKLSQDNVHSIASVMHALEWIKENEGKSLGEVMMLLPTSPLRQVDDVTGAINLFRESCAPSLVSIVDLGKLLTNLRYLNEGVLEAVFSNEDPNQQRQGAEKLFGVNGSIFIAKTEVLRRHGTFHVEGARGFTMSTISSVDINTVDDLEIAKMFSLLNNLNEK